MVTFDIALRNGLIVTPSGVVHGTLYIIGEKIAAISTDAVQWEAQREFDVTGKLILPGAIDVHAHLNDPGFTWREDFEHGTRAAARGGVTTIIDMPLQNEPALTSAEIYKKKHHAVKDQALVDYLFWGGLTSYNLNELVGMHDAGVPAFKVFIGPVSPDYESLAMGTVRHAMKIVASFGGMIGFHAEEYSIIRYEETRAINEGRLGRRDFLNSRPVIAELMATQNVIDLARETGVRAHICHVSHPSVADLIEKAQQEHLPVSGETCTHYLTFTENDLLERGMVFKCAPPLRSAKAQEGLWNHVIKGTLSCVASDHSPCAPHEKDESSGTFKAWGGISGIQNIMQVFYDQAVNRRHLDPTLIAARLSEGPAKLFGLWGKKGALAVGFDADCVIFDPTVSWTIRENSLVTLHQQSAFVGLSGCGMPVKTFIRGVLVDDSQNCLQPPGFGQLLQPVRD